MTDQSVNKKRSAREIRQSLEARQEQIDHDLSALGDRVQRTMNVRHQVTRHPLLFALAGAVVGFVVVRRPAVLLKAIRRLASIGAPILVSTLLRSPSPSLPAESDAPPSSPSQEA